jgi:sugar/nucleoside kinase (ribokinase family)
MAVTVVGSIAFDAVKTPFGTRERMLGGSAVHFALAASFFEQVHVVGPVGDDFGQDEYAVLEARNIDTSSIEKVPGGKTFFWRGEYGWDLNERTTLDTQLNVFADFDPKLSDDARASDVLFLANIQPELQQQVRAQSGARFVALDSMNLWIDTTRDALIETLSGVNCLMLNDGELRQLTREPNLVRAARQVREWGPSVVVAKQGEYGASMVTEEGFFGLPAYPLETVIDPTGAGDSFAGGFMGYIAAAGPDVELSHELLCRAMAFGTALASFNVEEFGVERVARLTSDEIAERVSHLQRLTQFSIADEMALGER